MGFSGLVRIGLVEGWTLGGSYVVSRMGGQAYEMIVLRRANRLSITPVTAAQWHYVNTRLLKSA